MPDYTNNYTAIGPPDEGLRVARLLFNVAMFMLAAFVTLELGFMKTIHYTSKIESKTILPNGSYHYNLSHGVYNECLDAFVGERVIFKQNRGYVTNLIWLEEPHEEYQCEDTKK